MAIKILNKYISLEIFKYFTIMLLVVIVIFITVDYINMMDRFLRAGMPLIRAFYWVLLRAPFVIALLIPAVVLLTVLTVFGLMHRNYEIVALKSSGISMFFLLRVTLIVGCLMSVGLFFLSEIVVPITHTKSNKIEQEEIRKKPYVTSRKKDIWIKKNHAITYIKYVKPRVLTINGVIYSVFDKHYNLVRRVDAEKGVYQDGKWVLYNLIEQTLDKKTGNYLAKFFQEKTEVLNIVPEDLTRVIKKVDEMSFPELLSYIKTVEAEGYDATAYRVGLYTKTSYPFACIIMCIIGLGIAVRTRRQRDLPTIITYGILTGVFYWVFHNTFLSLGYGEKLPPIVAAWVTNIIFLLVGGGMLANVE